MSFASIVGRPSPGRRNQKRPAMAGGWLVTFADLSAVMVAFFVLMFSMSEVDTDRWNGAVSALDRQFDLRDSAAAARPLAERNINQFDAESGDALGYLERVISGHLDEQAALSGATLSRDGDALVLSLPATLLFAPGEADIDRAGRAALFAVGGVLGRLDNDIEVVGHADPRLIQGAAGFDTNWELSLARAAAVARLLSAAGMRREIRIFGAGSGRFDDIDAGLPVDRRRAEARRVDIVVRARAGGVR